MARRKPPTTHGVCVVDKPTGVTSHDVVGMLRRRFNERQVGHAGTLDPDATGVLVVGVGMATRLLRYIESTRKHYIGEVVLGTSTSTLDAAGEVTGEYDMAGVTADDAQRVIDANLVGVISQVPPMVSAIKIDGRRLHELARQGIEVERAPRTVTIDRFTAAATSDPAVLAIDVVCSAGTYVRTLADDLGAMLGGGAHLRGLRRVAVGEFTLDDAGPPETCTLLPVEVAVRGLAHVVVDDQLAGLVANGRVLPEFADTGGDGPWALTLADSTLIAVYERYRPGEIKPAVVLPTAVQG